MLAGEGRLTCMIASRRRLRRTFDGDGSSLMPCIAENRLVLVISAATIIYVFIWLWTTTGTTMHLPTHHHHHFFSPTDPHIIHDAFFTRLPFSTFLWRKI